MAIRRAILMPKLGLTMTEGLLVEWRVAAGDAVKAGEVIFIVETDKISNEIEAPEDGTISELLTEPGDTVPVGATVATMTVDGLGGVEGSLPASTRGKFTSPTVERLIATPFARRLAARSGVDLSRIAGTGPRGRIMADDVAAAGDAAGTLGESSPVAAFSAPSPGAPPVDESVPLEGHGAVVTRRQSEYKRDVPHFCVFTEADVTELLTILEELNGAARSPKLTVSHFLIAAVARALLQLPEMNRIWAGESLRILTSIDVGLAVEGAKGLVTPVLHDLAGKTLSEIGEEAALLVERARDGRLVPEDLVGGAMTISNVGMFGATGLIPIINPGQSGILGVGRAQALFRPDAQDRPVVRKILNLSLACDHRVIDGGVAARFLQSVQTLLERPIALLCYS